MVESDNPELEYNEKCEQCGAKFHENHILYLCDKCNQYFCFKCYCRNHFEKHSEWRPFIIKNGKPKSFTTI